MTVATPEQWTLEQYTRPIRAETSGRRAKTHLAELKDAKGKPCHAYIKHYGPDLPHGLFNEWFGHTLFGALGIAQPPAAIMPAPVMGHGPIQWAFVSFVPKPSFEGSAKQIYNLAKPEQYKALVQRLFSECRHSLPRLIAADQLLLNGDRNVGNLLFTGKGKFLTIDFGEILGGSDGVRSNLLKPQPWVRSRLIEDLVSLSDLKPGFRNAIYAAAQLLNEQFYSCQRDIMQAIGYPENAETYLPFDAVWWRTLELEALFADKFSIIP